MSDFVFKILESEKLCSKIWNIHAHYIDFFLYLQWDYYLAGDKAYLDLLGNYKQLCSVMIEFFPIGNTESLSGLD